MYSTTKNATLLAKYLAANILIAATIGKPLYEQAVSLLSELDWVFYAQQIIQAFAG